MSQSDSKNADGEAEIPRELRHVLVTGASGNIGSHFARQCHERYVLRLMARPDEKPERIDAIRPFGEIVKADLLDAAALEQHCRGMDTVLHLAANASPYATWDSLLPNNIIGTYNLFTSAKSAGCRRVIFASSIHAVRGYPAQLQIRPDDPVNPQNLYGVSKCFGEALARYMAEQQGLSCVCIRIANFSLREPVGQPKLNDMGDPWVSPRDLIQLICKCIEAADLRFAIFHGASKNRFDRLDITSARRQVGYEPLDYSAAPAAD